MKVELDTCSFCGKHKDQVAKLIVGNNVGICNECVDFCQSLLTGNPPPEATEQEDLDARSIKEFLDRYVIGQDPAKIAISVAIVNHYKRLASPSDVEIDKSNILLLGPTGSGKTLLARTVARYLNVPFVIGDATSITEAGYVGDDVESLISRLITNANGDINAAKKGIVFLDEVDKISRKSESTSITRDVSGEGVQQALLKLIEGTVCRVPAQPSGRKHPAGEMIEFDTRNVLFICSGAFVGLDKIIEKRLQGTSIGFTAAVDGAEVTGLHSVNPDDLVRFGLIPEFVGRLPVRVALDGLDKDSLVKVLTGVKNSYVSQYQYLFGIDGLELEFSPQALDCIAQRAIDSATGARGLQSEIERVLLPHMFHIGLYKEKNLRHVFIDADQVNNPRILQGG